MCAVSHLHSHQDHWTGERVIFRGNLGNKGWSCRPHTCLLHVIIPGVVSEGSHAEVFARVKACSEALGFHLPASSFGVQQCGCQDLCLRKPQETSKGPVHLASFDLRRGSLRSMIKRNVEGSRYAQTPPQEETKALSSRLQESPSKET